MILHKTFPENPKFNEHEARLIFVDKNPDAENTDENIDEDDSEKTKTEKPKPNDAEKTLRKIEAAQKQEREKSEIAGEAMQNIREGYLDSVKKLRKFIRGKIDDLGVAGVAGIDKATGEKKQALEKFAKEIENRVNSLLGGVDADEIKKEVEAEKVRAKKCWRQIQDIFSGKNKTFLYALRLHDLPARLDDKKEEYSIPEILAMKNRINSSDDILIGTSGEDLFLLEEALNSIEKLNRKWKSAKSESEEKMQWKLDETEKGFSKLKFEIRDSGEFKNLKENWDQFATLKKNNFARFHKILSDPNSTESDRKLLAAFLEGEKEELGGLQKRLAKIREQKAKKDSAEKDTEITPTKKNDSGKVPTGKIEKEELGDHHNKKTIIHESIEKLIDGLTLGGNIQYYSIYDIVESLKLVKEACKKHAESVSEDKRPDVATGLMFWRQEIGRRIHHIDVAEERGRADDLKKTYKNFTDDQLLAELSELPAKDRRRAILESLADRGNLRMSNRRLIGIICPKEFDLDAWERADVEINYSPMREAFIKKIDKNFIDETGYGKELLQMQNAGFSKAEDVGKQFASSNEAGSSRAEVTMFEKQIRRVSMEGEGSVAGMLEQMIDRANTFGNNGNFIKSEIKVGGKTHDINRIADMGLVGLLITEAFTRGKLSRELMMKIGKGHEQVFRPFSVFQEVVGAKEKKDAITKKNISHFEYWGWIDANGITELGATQIINFFNTRNAKARIEIAQGKFIEKTVHIATDSCFKIHSGTRVTSIEEARASGKLGDKFAGYAMKATGIDVYDQATKLRRDTGSATGQLREITSMIKAGVEDFADGRQMMDSGEERYFDNFTGKEVNSNGYFINSTTQEVDFNANANGKGPIKEEQIIKMGEMRMERGTEILLRILKNMWLYREDRKVLEESPLYVFYDRDDTDEGVANEKSTKIKCPLRDFLEKSLGRKWSNSFEYQEIMRSVARLEDPSQKFSRAEIDKMKNSGVPKDIEQKEDLEKAA